MKIILLGSTGLVGTLVLQQLLADVRVTQVIAPTRRGLELTHAKLINPVIDFEAMPEDAPWWAADAVICTLGSTIKKAGSREAFRRVDFDYPLRAARLAKHAGTPTYVLNSAVGANAQSPIFYNQVKGELEAALKELGFSSLSLIQPGIIDGDRQESRPGEAMALFVSSLLRPVLPKAWRPSRAELIAKALVDQALRGDPGVHVIGSAAFA